MRLLLGLSLCAVGWFFWSYALEGEHLGGDTWSLKGVLASGIELQGSGRDLAPLVGLSALSPFRIALPMVVPGLGCLIVGLAIAAVAARRQRRQRWHADGALRSAVEAPDDERAYLRWRADTDAHVHPQR